MYFSRITLNRDKFVEIAKALKTVKRVETGKNYPEDKIPRYEDHQLVWRLFWNRPDSSRDFLFRKESENRQIQSGKGLPLFYVLSESPPQNHEDWFRIETKSFNPVLEKGMKLRFSLRANPVVFKKNDKGNKTRQDVMMDAKFRLRKDFETKRGEKWKDCPAARDEFSETLKHQQRDRALEWLAGRANALGFEFSPSSIEIGRVSSMSEVEWRKTNNRYRISFVDFEGTLTVSNPESFRETLCRGVGKAKGFGCGLMLLKRS